MVDLTGLSLAIGKPGRTPGRVRRVDILCPTACLEKLGPSVLGYDGHYKNIYTYMVYVYIFVHSS